MWRKELFRWTSSVGTPNLGEFAGSSDCRLSAQWLINLDQQVLLLIVVPKYTADWPGR